MNRAIYRTSLPFLFCALVAFGAGCSTPGEEPDDEHVEVVEEPESPEERFESMLDDAEQAWESRAQLDQARRAIELWDSALDDAPDDLSDERQAGVYEDIARAYYFIARFHLADGPVIDADTDLGDAVDEGRAAAERALELTAPEFRRAVDAGAPFEADIPDFPDEAATALLWYGKHLDLHARTGDRSTASSIQPVVDTIMERVAELQPDAHYGAAHRYWGVRWVDRLFHRSPDQSRQAFDTTLQTAPHYLPNRLYRALYLTSVDGDRDAFEQELRTIVDTAEERAEDDLPENDFARRWAEELLENPDRVFE